MDACEVTVASWSRIDTTAYVIYPIWHGGGSHPTSTTPVQFSSPILRIKYTSMDAILGERFQRVEAALNMLIDSITSYNPSLQAAKDLVAADDYFSEGLEQCTTIRHSHVEMLKLTIV